MSEDVSALEQRDRRFGCSTVVAPNGTIAVVPGVDLAPVLMAEWYDLPGPRPPAPNLKELLTRLKETP